MFIHFKKLLLLCPLIFCYSSPLQAQEEQGFIKRIYNKLFNDTTATAEPKFIVYPTLAYSPETKWEIGASALYVYYAKRDTSNRLSEINAFTFFTLEQQYGLWLDHALYSDQSTWFVLGRARFQQFPLLYYCIGADTPDEPLAVVDAGQILIRERLLRKITRNFYFGPQLDVQRISAVDFQPETDEPFPLPLGAQGSANVGLGAGLVYDNRHNVLNVRDGFFGELGFLRYANGTGSDFSFTNYFAEARYFTTTAPKQVLAAQFFSTGVAGGEAPFNQLALLGGESLMRGYYTGRFRDDNYTALQVEYRFLPFPFSKRIGGAAFLAAGGVAPAIKDINPSDWKVAGGAGLRFLIFPDKDIFTRLDVAFTEEGSGFYLFIGEAF
jgi:hypothetical protein